MAASASAASMESGREYRLHDPTPTVSNGGNADRSVSPDPCASDAEPLRKDDAMLSNGCLFLRSDFPTGLLLLLAGLAACTSADVLRIDPTPRPARSKQSVEVLFER